MGNKILSDLTFLIEFRSFHLLGSIDFLSDFLANRLPHLRVRFPFVVIQGDGIARNPGDLDILKMLFFFGFSDRLNICTPFIDSISQISALTIFASLAKIKSNC